MMYLFVKRLFRNDLMAFTAMFLTALSPLFVFFSHNVQLMNVGLFFMLTSLYLFTKWVKNNKNKALYWSMLFFTLATLTKYGFAIVAVPMLFMVPMKRYKNLKNYVKPLIISALIISPIILWIVYVEYFIASAAGTGTAIQQTFFRPLLVFSSEWINVMKAYIADNYTTLGFYFALVGVIFTFFFARKSLGSRFLYGSLVGTILFTFIMAFKMQGHSYHQFPIAPFVIIFMTYFIMVVSTNLPKYLVKNNAKVARSVRVFLIIFLIFLLYSPSIEAKDRQFNTQFVGLDIAGDYIREHSLEDERIVHSGHQDYGVLWHADRKGTDGGIPTVEDLKYAEDNLNVQWVFVYQWGLQSLSDPEKLEYLSSNYRIVQIGLQGEQLLYLVLRRGGSFDVNTLNELAADKEVLVREYEYTMGKSAVQYINIE